jgi:ABC-2 type transport system permease protein
VLQAFLGIAYKEFVQAFRNKHALRMLCILQIMDFVMLAWIDTSIRNVPTVIVDQDHTAESRQLVERLRATQIFKTSYTTSSTEQAREHVRAGRARVAIVIPSDYARMRASNGEAKILALIDGTEQNLSQQASATVEGVAEQMNVEAQQELVEGQGGVTVHPMLLYNPSGSVSLFMLPGLLAIMLGNGYAFFAMNGLTREREGGNLERLLMTPMNYNGLILGKLAPWFLMGVVNSIVYMLIIRWGFDVPIRGSLVVLMLAITLFTLSSLAFGSFAASKAKNAGEAGLIFGIVLLPTTMLTGYVFPLSCVPKFLLPISYALPHTHFIEVMRGVCLRGASLSELAPHLIYLALSPLVLTVLAARRFASSVMQ